MHRQSKLCRDCSLQDPAWKAKLSAVRAGVPTYKRTPEMNLAMSARTTGILRPGWKPPSATLDVADRIRQSWTPEKREAARLRGLQNATDLQWRLSCGRPGESSPTWEHGRTAIPYARGWTRRWKQAAWDRARYCCEICLSDKPRDTHLKDFRKDNHLLDNLQVLCRPCHKKLHAEHRRAMRSAPLHGMNRPDRPESPG